MPTEIQRPTNTRFSVRPLKCRSKAACVATLSVAFLIGGFVLLQPVFAGIPADAVSTIRVVTEEEHRDIVVEEFHPPQMYPGCDRALPAVLYLHGVEGADRYRSVHSRNCRSLADQGYRVFYAHYFGCVDYADLWHLNDDGSLNRSRIDPQCRADAQRWCSAVSQILKEIGRRADVDENRIAIDGVSLGGFIALEVADEAQRDAEIPDVCAVIANWSAQFEITHCQPGFPPTLHIHGELDEVVPIEDARGSVAEIRSVGSHAELFVIPNVGHVARSAQSDELTNTFLQSRLTLSSSRQSRSN